MMLYVLTIACAVGNLGCPLGKPLSFDVKAKSEKECLEMSAKGLEDYHQDQKKFVLKCKKK